MVNLENHTDTVFCHQDDTTVSKHVNNPRFNNLQEISDDLLEIQNRKSKLRLNVPIQIGFFVLEYAKLSILKFYYDFILKYLPLDGFCLIEADTDALYLALSEKTLYSTVKTGMRAEFMEEHDQWLCREYCDIHKPNFFKAMFSGHIWEPEDCCKTVAKYYQRSAGLFHCENVSTGVVALCSKCYYCFGKDPKYSSKGVSKKYNNYTERDYLDVLHNQKIKDGTNKGFRVKGEQILTYVQTRKGLNYMYGKRIVSSDHVTTRPTLL